MNIGILTHYTVVNQGAVLQMYAVQRWLQEHGHTATILTYTKDFDFALKEAGKYNLSLKYFPFYFKEYVLKKGIGLSWFNVRKQLMYRKYIHDMFQFSNYATTPMDAVIVGSDEVFSLQNGCNMMMYGHGVNTDRLISYAPSFGQTDMARIEQFHCRELISSGLKKFQALSVRDLNSAETVEQLTGIRPQIVCDPVLLFDFSNTHVPVRPIKKPYLLLYSYDRWMCDPKEYNGIKAYAKSKGLITVSAGTYHKWCDKNIVCNPLEWLEYFRGAAEVVTDTFHGSVLSIITQRKTAYYIHDLNSNKMHSLLKSVGLEDRIVRNTGADEISRVQQLPVDFADVSRRLNDLRASSDAFLTNALAVESDKDDE